MIHHYSSRRRRQDRNLVPRRLADAWVTTVSPVTSPPRSSKWPMWLEQHKGWIQHIGQQQDLVDTYNLRYWGSVKDRVHELLSQRLADISNLFGQLPDYSRGGMGACLE